MSHVANKVRPFAWAMVLLLAAANFSPWSAALWAQQAPPADKGPAAKPSAAPPAKHETLESTAEPVSIGRVLLEKTNWLGWCFYAMEGTLSVMALSCTLERLVNLRRRKLMPPRFVRRIHDLVARREDSAENLMSLCEGSESRFAGILRAGVLRAGRPLAEVEKAMEDAMGRESSAQRGRIRTLAVIAYIAPMVGLLGTVVGMILAFRVTSQAGTGKAELLAEGIYLALLRTAFGLVIAVPSLYMANFFNTRVERVHARYGRCLGGRGAQLRGLGENA